VLVKSEIKYIQSLGQKKFRDEDGVFIAEGVKIINELLVAPNAALVKLFVTEDCLEMNNGIILHLPQDKVNVIKESELERISFLQTPNHVFGIFKKPVFQPFEANKGVILVLDDIQDPGNLGTIIRTADWFNIKMIYCSKESADAFNPKVVQSTMGSIGRVEVNYGDPETLMNGHSDMPVYAATLHGENIFETKKITKGFILIGNESKGIDPGLLKPSVHQVTIPKLGNGESLNAGVAAGILMANLCEGILKQP
jgi:TrmH family RNA methyltransferase